MADRNLGNQVAGGSNVQTPPAGNKAVCRFQNTSGKPITVSKLYFDMTGASTDTTVKFKAVIYSDVASAPTTLLATSDEIVGINTSTGGNWLPFNFSTTYTVAAGAYVWMGIMSDTGSSSQKCTSGGPGNIYYNANTYGSGPSGTFGSPSIANYTYRMIGVGDDGENTFGRASIDGALAGASDGNYQPDREHVDRVILGGASSVTVTSISVYVRTTDGSVKSKAAIYADSSGYPGSKLAQSVEVTGSTADTWMQLTITGGVVLSPGTYWLAFITDTNLVTPVIPFTGHLIVDGPMTESSAFDSTYPVGSPVSILDPIFDGRGIDIYANYTPGGGGGGGGNRTQIFVCM